MKIRGWLGVVGLGLLVTACNSIMPGDDSNGSESGSKADGSSGGNNSSGGSPTGTPAALPPEIKSDCAPANVQMGVPQSIAMRKDAYSKNIAAADLNNDGKVDIVVYEGGSPGGIEVFLSHGDGTFGQAFYEQHPSNGNGMALGDFDGDGHIDIVVNSFGTGSVDTTVDVLLNKGDGTFGGVPQNTGITTSNVSVLVSADLNGDKRPDLLYDGQEGSGSMLNAGSSFAAASNKPEIQSTYFGVGDFNGDGAADIVMTNNEKAMCVLLNSGSGQFGEAKCYPGLTNTSQDYYAVGDVNGDGKLDVIGVYDGHSGIEDTSNIALYLGKGDGTFEDRKPVKLPGAYADVKLVDMNNDGKADLVTSKQFASASVGVALSNGDGTFATTATEYPMGSESGSAFEPFAIGDFGGNGLRGAAVINHAKPAVDVMMATCKK